MKPHLHAAGICDCCEAPPSREDAPYLDGWYVSICPGCGTQVAEWLDEDGGLGHVEHELCPMCNESDRMDLEEMGL